VSCGSARSLLPSAVAPDRVNHLAGRGAPWHAPRELKD